MAPRRRPLQEIVPNKSIRTFFAPVAKSPIAKKEKVASPIKARNIKANEIVARAQAVIDKARLIASAAVASDCDDGTLETLSMSLRAMEELKEPDAFVGVSNLTMVAPITTMDTSPIAMLDAPATILSISDIAPVLVRQPGQVATYDYVYGIIFGKFTELHTQNPQHSIFGKIEKNMYRAPFDISGRNQVSWRQKVQVLAKLIQKETGPWITPGDCWMKRDPAMDFSRRVDGKPAENLFSVQIVRLLAFLASPTDNNWLALTGQSKDANLYRSVDTPFTHWCHNGHGSKRGGGNGGVSGCVNGIQHGRFATALENAEQKACRDGDRAGCKGHGVEPRVFCIYVHEDGVQKPCLNLRDGKPERCLCVRKCF